MDCRPSGEEGTHGELPTGESRFSVGEVSLAKDPAARWGFVAIRSHRLGDRIDIPHGERARFKIIGPLGDNLSLGPVRVVGLAANFDGKRRRQTSAGRR